MLVHAIIERVPDIVVDIWRPWRFAAPVKSWRCGRPCQMVADFKAVLLQDSEEIEHFAPGFRDLEVEVCLAPQVTGQLIGWPADNHDGELDSVYDCNVCGLGRLQR